MTQLADTARSRRQRFAAPGGSHDRLIGILRVALPSAVGALFAVLAVTPLAGTNELSFLVDKNEVEVAPDRLRVTEALYRGADDRGQPFSLRAASAVQRNSSEQVVELSDLVGRILLSDGPAVLRAGSGAYDLAQENVRVIGPVQFSSEGGYDLTTRDVTVSMGNRTLASQGPVSGSTKLGTFSADRLTADLEGRIVRLDGHARLRIRQDGLR